MNASFRHTLGRRAALALILGSLAACASVQFAPPATTTPGLALKGAKVQVYSFLDLREQELGTKLLSAFDHQLVDELRRADVQAQVLRFRETEAGRYFELGNHGLTVPVKQVVNDNAAGEREFGATYRLVVFPTNMVIQGAWRFYDIRWDLIDTSNGRVAWSTTSHGKHINAWRNDEDPDERAKNFVDGIIAAMKASALI